MSRDSEHTFWSSMSKCVLIRLCSGAMLAYALIAQPGSLEFQVHPQARGQGIARHTVNNGEDSHSEDWKFFQKLLTGI
jgi:GNAT superfamily N-acetyltransferase